MWGKQVFLKFLPSSVCLVRLESSRLSQLLDLQVVVTSFARVRHVNHLQVNCSPTRRHAFAVLLRSLSSSGFNCKTKDSYPHLFGFLTHLCRYFHSNLKMWPQDATVWSGVIVKVSWPVQINFTVTFTALPSCICTQDSINVWEKSWKKPVSVLFKLCCVQKKIVQKSEDHPKPLLFKNVLFTTVMTCPDMVVCRGSEVDLLTCQAEAWWTLSNAFTTHEWTKGQGEIKYFLTSPPWKSYVLFVRQRLIEFRLWDLWPQTHLQVRAQGFREDEE